MFKLKKILSVFLAVLMLFSLTSVAFAAETKLNFLSLGDSIAAGAGLLNPAKQSYGAIVSDTNGYNFTNDAISGHTTQQMYRRINEKRVSKHIAEADIICVSIGGNNFLTANLPELIVDATQKHDFTKFDEIAEEYYSELGKIMTCLREKNPLATIILQTLYNPMYISPELRAAYQEGADRLNNTMRRYLADHEGAYVLVDMAEPFGDDESLINADYIHPNSQGHIVMAGVVLKALSELGLGENTEPVYNESKVSTAFDKFLYKLRQFLASIINLFK